MKNKLRKYTSTDFANPFHLSKARKVQKVTHLSIVTLNELLNG